MNGYTKLFSTIVTSTIWQEPLGCRVLWITMLALKNRHHICNATVPSLAQLSGLSIEETEKYLLKFQGPDTYSRSQEFEGRRIEKVPTGWLILNGEKYRDLMNGDERREYVRGKVREYRKRNVNKCKQMKTLYTHTDTDTDTKTDTEKEIKPPISPKGFDVFWERYPKKVGKGAAEKAWIKLKPPPEDVLKALDWQTTSEQWAKDGGQFVPNPATYLNQQRWKDERVKTWQEKFRELTKDIPDDETGVRGGIRETDAGVHRTEAGAKGQDLLRRAAEFLPRKL